MASNSVTVLHVDDDSEFLDLTEAYLQRVDPGIAVRPETSVAAALERLEREPIDCIVSDYEMPATDGLAFLEKVRDGGWTVPFVLLTWAEPGEVASEVRSADAADYVRKSGSTEQYELLASRIRTLAGNHDAGYHVGEVY